MATSKSPFLVYDSFLSPLKCEEIIDRYGFTTEPDVDTEGVPLKRIKHVDDVEKFVFDRYFPGVKTIEHYFDFEYRGTTEIMIEHYDQGVVSEHVCDNSAYISKKWARTRDRDFSVVIFLNDYQESTPFDSDYNVKGGKLEFPQHQFSFQPQRGTMLIYPSGPHFINVISPIEVGESYMIKFNITASMPYMYNPENFPGDYTTWFADHL